MKRLIHQLLFLLFIALQSIAPVAHAHLNNKVSDNQSPHLHTFSKKTVSGSYIYNQPSYVVATPDTFHRVRDNGDVAINAALPAKNFTLKINALVVFHLPRRTAYTFILSNHWPQAPPGQLFARA